MDQIVVNHKAKAEAPAKGRAEVVILQTSEESLPYTGIFIFNSSSSAGAPKCPPYPAKVQIADALAELVSQGYEVQMNDQYGNRWLAIKRP